MAIMELKVLVCSPHVSILRDWSFDTHPDCCIDVPLFDAAEHYQHPQDPPEEELQAARDTAQERRIASLESTRSGATNHH